LKMHQGANRTLSYETLDPADVATCRALAGHSMSLNPVGRAH
jgi:hypothetical protein